jgi:hypothetical protein
MPQKLSMVCDVPGKITLSPHVFKDRPEEAVLVARIVSTWATIEHELATTLMRMLGATEAVALAMFTALDAASARRAALNAAAKAAYEGNNEGYMVYAAVTGAAFSAGKKRHKVAHWLWGGCENLPGALLLADPDAVGRTEKAHLIAQDNPLDEPELSTEADVNAWLSKFQWDPSRIYVYTDKDLQRDLADLEEVSTIMFWYRMYLRPHRTEAQIDHLKTLGHESSPLGTASEALRQLSRLRLYQEARYRLEKDTSNSPESPP